MPLETQLEGVFASSFDHRRPALLDPSRFVRVHRSHLVNLARVASIEPLDSGDARVHLRDGTIVDCSRRHRDALHRAPG